MCDQFKSIFSFFLIFLICRTVVALHVLLEKVLTLPVEVLPAAERANWAAFQQILPPVPLLEVFLTWA